MYMSKVLNLKIHNNDMKLTFFEDVTQEDQFGLIMESHNLQKMGGIHSTKRIVTSLSFKFFVEAFIQDECYLGGLPMQMYAHLPF